MKKISAKLTGTIVLFIILMLVPMIVLAVTNDKIQIINHTDEQGNEEYMVYIQELLNKNFVFAVSDSADTPEGSLVYITAQDGEGNYIASIKNEAVTGNSTFLHLRYDDENGQEVKEVIELDLSKALDRTDMEYVENTTKRIETETVRDLVEMDEVINGVQTTLTVGGLRITDKDNATYYYELTKVIENTLYSRLFTLANELNADDYTNKDMYSKIELTSEFHNVYNQLIASANWTEVSNKEIRQPNDAITGDQYVVLIKKVAEDGTETTDAKLMISTINPYEEKTPERQETKTVQETTKLPITGDSIVIFLALAMVVIALIIVFGRMKKLNKKEDK